MNRMAFVLGAALALAPLTASASVIFSENFNAENGGVGALNYSGFAQFTVANGTVDLIGNGFFDFLPGNGLFVDLDGSTADSGELLSFTSNLGAGSYNFSYQLAGSHRGTTEDVEVSVLLSGIPIFSTIHTLLSGDPFTLFNIAIGVGGPGVLPFSFQFENITNGGDNIGALLDNVVLTDTTVRATPAPAGIYLALSAIPFFAGRRVLRRKSA